jgi:ATP adenylyltransferase/5',5'''-P-1,P-4-tetraphosphate phosphorylase II
MSWKERIIGIEELRTYLLNKSEPDFRSLIEGLAAHQLATWPMLRDAVAGLSRVEYKRLSVKGSEVLAQFNPQRIVSTAAKVDAATIKQRPCFLCAENLPPEERGIAFGADFVALYNPFPVLPRHLVITSRRHIPQTIEGNFGTLLDLALDLGGEFFVVYNGAACGASAPDHLHFQACERESLPIIREIETWERGRDAKSCVSAKSNDFGIEMFTLKDYRLNALIARSNGRVALIEWFNRALHCLAKVTGATSEPMINLVVTRDASQWTVIVFPRGKHRPDRYFAEGDAKLTVSPAAIDLAGVLVAPQPDHFAKITSRDAEEIYAEVTLDNTAFDNWLRNECDL